MRTQNAPEILAAKLAQWLDENGQTKRANDARSILKSLGGQRAMIRTLQQEIAKARGNA